MGYQFDESDSTDDDEEFMDEDETEVNKPKHKNPRLSGEMKSGTTKWTDKHSRDVSTNQKRRLRFEFLVS